MFCDFTQGDHAAGWRALLFATVHLALGLRDDFFPPRYKAIRETFWSVYKAALAALILYAAAASELGDKVYDLITSADIDHVSIPDNSFENMSTIVFVLLEYLRGKAILDVANHSIACYQSASLDKVTSIVEKTATLMALFGLFGCNILPGLVVYRLLRTFLLTLEKKITELLPSSVRKKLDPDWQVARNSMKAFLDLKLLQFLAQHALTDSSRSGLLLGALYAFRKVNKDRKGIVRWLRQRYHIE